MQCINFAKEKKMKKKERGGLVVIIILIVICIEESNVGKIRMRGRSRRWWWMES